jgi:VanZ family protein
MKLLSLAYLALLTLALLVRNPFGRLGPEMERTALLRIVSPAAHFGCFALLTYLLLRARWPWPKGVTVFALLAYAVATELLQALVPPRVPDPADLVLNLLGIAAGGYLYGRRARRAGEALAFENLN